MDPTLLTILIALAVMLFGWGVAQAIASLYDGDRKKLAKRLTSESSTPDAAASRRRSIVPQLQASGASASVAGWAACQDLSRKLVPAWPDLSLARFLGFVAAGAVGGTLVAGLVTASILLALIGAGAGGYLPFLLLARKRATRQRLLADQLPE